MTQNAYAKSYTTEAQGKKDAKFAFISYMDEPNSFSVVSIKRLINVDNFGKGSIREQNKTYRITVERTDTLIEMEQLAQEAEELSTYKMNSDVNDCKASFDYIIAYIFTIHFLDLFDKQLTELHTLDLDVYRTYTTLNTCLFDEPNKAGEVSRISSDKDDDDESSCDEDQEAGKTADGHILNSTLNCIPTSKSKKRTSSRVSRRIPEKRLRVNDTSSPTKMNYNLIQLCKQIAGLTRSYDQHQKTLNLILNNQKKIAKAIRNHKIPIVLIDETGHEPPASTIDSSTISCKSTTGEKIELLQIPADRTNPNKFVLKAVDRIFKEGKELIDLDPRSIDTDDRIKTIRDAVQVKFSLTNDELATVWMPMLECIKSK
ncbi:unnamed protein product [Rotaria socialis]|nr:unnamed protein product [Rotaria socialis]